MLYTCLQSIANALDFEILLGEDLTPSLRVIEDNR